MKHVLTLLTVLLLVPLAALHVAETPRPNFVFVLVDDLGYGDLSCHRNPVFQTPNMDRLHAEGCGSRISA